MDGDYIKTIQKCWMCGNDDKHDILDDVRKIINGERQDVYGNPEMSFCIIADLWTTYLHYKHGLNYKLSEGDIAVMMTLFKIARMIKTPNHKDSIIDAIGYLAILGERLTGK